MEMKVVNQSMFWLVCLIWTCDAGAQVKSDPDEVASLVELLEDDGVPDPRTFRREQLALTRDAGTIVPGAWQLEITAGTLDLRNYQDVSNTSTSFVEFINLRHGLTPDIEVQVAVGTNFFDAFLSDGRDPNLGFEFIPELAAKINLTGNDSEGWGVALRPWFQFGDLSRSDADDVALGLDLPATYQLDEKIELRMLVTSCLYDKNSDPPLISGVLGVRTKLGEKLHGSLGAQFDVNTDPRVRTSSARLAWVFDWLTDENIMIDAGVTLGLEQSDGSNDDIAYHVGYSVGF